MEEFGFPPRIEHVKEAVILLKGDWDEEVGKNWITRFLNRHSDLVSKFSTQFDKKRLKANDPELLHDHFRKILCLITIHSITKKDMDNMDEKGFRQGIADRSKVICKRLSKEGVER